MENVDKKTRRILCMTGNFHRNSDVNRLYLKRTEGGRGLKSFEETYISRIVSLKRHIEQDRDKNHYLENVYHHEKDRIVRLGKLYLVEIQREKIQDKHQRPQVTRSNGDCVKVIKRNG